MKLFNFNFSDFKIIHMNKSSLTLEQNGKIIYIHRNILNILIANPDYPAAIIENEKGFSWIATLKIM